MVLEVILRYACSENLYVTIQITSMALKLRFGRRLRLLRRRRDLTQEQLAELINVSVESISNMERGINAPSFETLEKLEAALQMPVHLMFDFEKGED